MIRHETVRAATRGALRIAHGLAAALRTLAPVAIALLIFARAIEAQVLRATAPTPILSIGVESGDPSKEFGNIDGIAVDDNLGVLFVLDRLSHKLSAFSSEGDFLASTGRQGSGPGEYRIPRALVAHDSDIYVYDNGNMRISTYTIRGDSLALVDDARMPIDNVWDMCWLNGHLFVLRYHQGHLIHRVTPDGHLTASFGAPFRDPQLERVAFTDNGHIFCNSADGSIYVAARATPVVRRYATNGTMLYESAVPGMVPPRISIASNGGVRFSRPENRDNSDAIVSLVVIPSGQLLIQYGETFSGATSEDIVDVVSIVYDADSGAVLARVDDLPRIDFVSGRRAYSHGNDPFPRVIVYDWR